MISHIDLHCNTKKLALTSPCFFQPRNRALHTKRIVVIAVGSVTMTLTSVMVTRTAGMDKTKSFAVRDFHYYIVTKTGIDRDQIKGENTTD